ncbi:reverse transcriptase [Senna tora]|uniref:Reverse transcriptase n=1 Tax=Senna tora TaxID=362788 RepID=A0A834WGS1_9FABA|nr:reverse transcriptase [Senna tora]
MFFLQDDLGNCVEMKNILNMYCKASGQQANFDKSCIFFSENTNHDLRKEICAILEIKSNVDPSDYLGLPLMWGRSRREALGFIRSKVQRKIQGWKQGLLTQAGREKLIKSVASAKKDEGKIHWVAWDKLTKAKKDGGMGFRDFECFNRAMLAKQCWRLMHNSDDPWVRILKGPYFPNCNFLEAKKSARASWAWSSLLEEQQVSEYISNGIWDVGKLSGVVSYEELEVIKKIPLVRINGDDKMVWDKTWVATMCSQIWKDRCGHMFQGNVMDPCALVKAANRLVEDFWRIKVNEMGLNGDCIKINTDGAFLLKENKAGLRVVVRNSDGVVIDGLARSVDNVSAAFSEAIAMKGALELGKENN